MQRPGTEAIRTQIQPSKLKREITKITNSQNTKRTIIIMQRWAYDFRYVNLNDLCILKQKIYVRFSMSNISVVATNIKPKNFPERQTREDRNCFEFIFNF